MGHKSAETRLNCQELREGERHLLGSVSFGCTLEGFVRRKNLPRRSFASFFRNLTWGNAALELLKGRNNVTRETRARSICAKRRTRGPSVHAYDSRARFWRTYITWIKLLLRVLRPLTCFLVSQSPVVQTRLQLGQRRLLNRAVKLAQKRHPRIPQAHLLLRARPMAVSKRILQRALIRRRLLPLSMKSRT